VATVSFGDRTVSFYMHGEQWNRLTSLAPHPFWIMKQGFEENKAVFSVQTRQFQKTFADP
ncbi:unnamed protein product, partial [Effrenium voratum]